MLNGHKRRRKRRHPQQGRAIVSRLGDTGEITFPDHGAQPMRIRIEKYQSRPRDGYGSHMNGRHKLG